MRPSSPCSPQRCSSSAPRPALIKAPDGGVHPASAHLSSLAVSIPKRAHHAVGLAAVQLAHRRLRWWLLWLYSVLGMPLGPAFLDACRRGVSPVGPRVPLPHPHGQLLDDRAASRSRCRPSTRTESGSSRMSGACPAPGTRPLRSLDVAMGVCDFEERHGPKPPGAELVSTHIQSHTYDGDSPFGALWA
jgi:hypothetical protein